MQISRIIITVFGIDSKLIRYSVFYPCEGSTALPEAGRGEPSNWSSQALRWLPLHAPSDRGYAGSHDLRRRRARRRLQPISPVQLRHVRLLLQRHLQAHEGKNVSSGCFVIE